MADRRRGGAEDVADVLEVVEDGRAGGAAAAAGALAAARRDWRVVLLVTPVVESLVERGLVGDVVPLPLGGRGLEVDAGGFRGAALGAWGRGWAMILMTLSRPTKRPCNGVHWK